MVNTQIKNEIINHLNNTLDINLTKSDCDKNLLVPPISLRPIELVYIFYGLEQKFNLEMNIDMVKDGLFTTINNIADIINASKERV